MMPALFSCQKLKKRSLLPKEEKSVLRTLRSVLPKEEKSVLRTLRSGL